MTSNTYDLIVVGAGPGGEVGAIKAAQLGLKVALVEKNEHLGGTCLNVGCIPTKALLESAKTWSKLQHVEELGFNIENPTYSWEKILARKDNIVDTQRKGLKFLMKKNKIDTFHGHARLTDKNTIEVTKSDNSGKEILKTKNILLATGSRVRHLPFAKPNGTSIMTSDEILFIKKIPESLCVIGGGVIGMEFASLFSRFGTKVTVIEMAPQILPFEDGEVVKELTRQFKKAKIEIKTKTKLTGITAHQDHAIVSTEGGQDEKFEVVLVSIGRAPVTDDIGLDKVGISTDKAGFIPVDVHYRTSTPGIFAIGDIIATPMLAHTASAEAMHAVEIIAGHQPKVIDYQTNPGAIYTSPEVASVGMTEETLKEKGIAYEVSKFPFAPLAKAKIEGATEGFVKIIYDPQYREILGAHIIGAKASEMIGEFVLGKILETTVDEIGQAIHPHPTLSETIMEAAHAVHGAIHL